MRRLIMLFAVVFLTSVAAQAQSYPSTEIFAGYSFTSTDIGERESLHGWGLSFAGNLSERWGFKADISGGYGEFDLGPLFGEVDLNTHHFLFGPQISARNQTATAFGHFLLGGTRVKLADGSDSGFAMGIGGGADINVNDSFAIRVVQADYIPHRLGGDWRHDFRYQAGVVIKLGGN